jgi:hypothetical protein
MDRADRPEPPRITPRERDLVAEIRQLMGGKLATTPTMEPPPCPEPPPASP